MAYLLLMHFCPFSPIPLFKLPYLGATEQLPGSNNKVRIPLWSDTSKQSNEINGYALFTSNANIKFHSLTINELELYYYCPSTENEIDDSSSSQLYMVKMKATSYIDDNGFKRVLEGLSNSFGKPKLKETYDQGFITMVSNTGYYNGPYKTYHRIYTWNGANNTGMRLLIDFTDYNKSYENLIIYLGKTNMDGIINKKVRSTSITASPSQVTVEKKTIGLRDENKKLIQKLEVGTVLQIIGYNDDLNMFAAVVVDGSSNAEEKAAKGSFDGYVTGDNLSVSRGELLKQFKE